MCRKLAYVTFYVLVLAASAAVQAQMFTDDFEMPHDYVADGVEGTGWDGFLGLNPGETVDALNASMDRTGQLYLESTGAFYHEPWDPLGPFLYKIVQGDFVATVKVTDYAGTAAAPVYHNNCGLLARANPDDAGPGEDWVAIDYFPIWSCGNYVRSANDDVRSEDCHNGTQFDLDPYLQLERKGNTFHFRTSADGSSWTEMRCSPMVRDDLAGLPLQVGLNQATYSGTAGYAAFDDFSVGRVVKLKAYDPQPVDGADDVTIPLLQWKAGETAAYHDVYVGTDPAALVLMAHNPRARTDYYYTAGITPGTTYYWRVDEVEVDGITVHTGDVWSFMAVPLAAWNPVPPDGAQYVFTDAALSWGAGSTASSHDVYFGTDEAAVADGTGGTFKGNQLGVTYRPQDLAKDTTYYWRIDEVEFGGATKHKGPVWSFRTIPDIPISDPDLIGWWKFDEGSGVTAFDSSGYGNHGTLMAGPQWVDGYDGGALEFDGYDDIVNIPYSPDMTPSEGLTMSAWVFPTDTTRGTIIGQFGAYSMSLLGGLQLKSVIWGDDWVLSDVTIDRGQWSHIAMTWDVTSNQRRIFLNGDLVGQRGDSLPIPELTNNLGIGVFVDWPANWAEDWFTGVIDDVRMYKKVLTAAEIPQTMRGDPLLAWNPKPVNSSTPDIEGATSLSWSPGDKAAQHDVYFGIDKDAVTGADTSDTTGIYRGRQPGTSYAPAEALQWGGTYYWRIDEYNTDGTISKGRVWSFTVADYLIVDDFEQYDDYCGRIFFAWTDGWGHSGDAGCGVPAYGGNGSGSTVGHLDAPFAEQTIIHAGSQSMPFAYNNSATPYYSETERLFDTAQDWTRYGVKALTLWFRGYPVSVGSFNYAAGTDTYTLTADGTDIWSTTDHFHYGFKQLSGVGSIVARVLSVSDTDPWAKAGVMIRDTLDPNSMHAMAVVTPGQGVSFQYRTSTAGGSEETTQAGITAPLWVKLERRIGGELAASYSTDGSSWTPLGSAVAIGMAGDVYVGLALTSHNPGATCVAEFSNVVPTGSVSGQWQSQDIGITSNMVEPLYVAVQDSTGKVGVVEHENPNATVLDSWQEWNIDLREFRNAGVNLASIKKMYLGVGDRISPQQGGTGNLYFDDIRLYRPRCVPAMGRPQADLSGNCVVDYADLEIMAGEWLGSAAAPASDLDGDGDVGLQDYAILADAWLESLLWPQP